MVTIHKLGVFLTLSCRYQRICNVSGFPKNMQKINCLKFSENLRDEYVAGEYYSKIDWEISCQGNL